MGLTINTNTQSLFAQRSLSSNTFGLQKSIERLSTGFRINRAGDDAAGLSITEKMTAEIRGLNQARRNAADGISLLQTAEGGLSVIHENLQRIRELMVQGINGTNGTSEVDALQREINSRVTAINDIATATKFNSQALLKGGTNKTLQTGANSGETTTIIIAPAAANQGIDVDITKASANGQLSEGSGVALYKFGLSTATIKAQDAATAPSGSLADIDTMVNNVSRMRSELGAVQNSLESKIQYLAIAAENVSGSRSRIKDADIAEESSTFVKNQILQQSAAAMLGQANSSPQLALNLLPR